MAEIPAVAARGGGGVMTITWSGLAGGDTGGEVDVAGFPIRSVQAVGDATSVVLQGSNDGTNFAAFPTAVDLDGTANEIAELPTAVRYVKISSVTAGTDTDVVLLAHTHR